MILVTGATGHFGKAVIGFLLKKGIAANEISALVRHEGKAADIKDKGIALKTGDYDQYDSLTAAFQGVDKLLLVSATDISKRRLQHENVIHAAKEAGVKHIYYTSFERRNETASSPMALLSQSHLDTEKSIKAAGIPYTIFRNNLYLDVLPQFAGERVMETGIFFPAGSARAAFASRVNMAEATANVIAGEGHENKSYSLSNTQLVTFKEIAETLSGISGKPVNYVSPAKEAYIDTLVGAGVPNEYATLYAGLGQAIAAGEFETLHTDLENFLGRKPTSMKEFLSEVYA